jgi:CheY-like chemotaxis protein
MAVKNHKDSAVTKARIVCIDDNPANLLLVEKSLRDQYEILPVTDAEAALATLVEVPPALVLLDVNMPRLNGYELCRRIRDHDTIGDIPIVFVSCMKDLDDRLAGYAAGGDGYITKPFDLRELRSIVQAHIQRRQQLDETRRSMENLRTMSWTMMRNNSEMGELLRFSQGLAKVKDEAAFVDHLFTTINNLGLSTTLLVKLLTGEIVARNDGKPFTLIEKELLDLASNGPRITANGNKCLFRGDSLILLIRNMPVDDDALTGRLKDHLCILLDSAEASITIINGEKQRAQLLNDRADQTADHIHQEFDTLTHTAEQLHTQSSASIEGLANALEHAFMVMDLTEEQEQQIQAFIERARTEVEHQHALTALFQQSMQRIVEMVTNLKQHV